MRINIVKNIKFYNSYLKKIAMFKYSEDIHYTHVLNEW